MREFPGDIEEAEAFEGSVGGGQEQDDEAEGDEGVVPAFERLVAGDEGMAHAGGEEDGGPENPADPEEEASEQKSDGQEKTQATMDARRDGVEDVSAIELAGGHEIERSDEEADPAGDQDRMAEGVCEGGRGWMEPGKDAMHHIEGERVAEADEFGMEGLGMDGRGAG